MPLRYPFGSGSRGLSDERSRRRYRELTPRRYRLPRHIGSRSWLATRIASHRRASPLVGLTIRRWTRPHRPTPAPPSTPRRAPSEQRHARLATPLERAVAYGWLLQALGQHVTEVTVERDAALTGVLSQDTHASHRQLALDLGLSRQRVDQLAAIATCGGRSRRVGRLTNTGSDSRMRPPRSRTARMRTRPGRNGRARRALGLKTLIWNGWRSGTPVAPGQLTCASAAVTT